MIISCSQCWTCCLKQFDACPLTADHLAILRARKRQEKSRSLALSSVFLRIRVMRKMQICLLPGQLLCCCSPGSSVCRMAKDPGWAPELLPCTSHALRLLPAHPQGREQNQLLHFGTETISHLNCLFSTSDSKVNKWNEHNVLPVVQKQQKT